MSFSCLSKDNKTHLHIFKFCWFWVPELLSWTYVAQITSLVPGFSQRLLSPLHSTGDSDENRKIVLVCFDHKSQSKRKPSAHWRKARKDRNLKHPAFVLVKYSAIKTCFVTRKFTSCPAMRGTTKGLSGMPVLVTCLKSLLLRVRWICFNFQAPLAIRIMFGGSVRATCCMWKLLFTRSNRRRFRVLCPV